MKKRNYSNISSKGRASIANAQRARWARFHAEKNAQAAPVAIGAFSIKPRKKKKPMTEAHKRAIQEGLARSRAERAAAQGRGQAIVAAAARKAMPEKVALNPGNVINVILARNGLPSTESFHRAIHLCGQIGVLEVELREVLGVQA